MKKLLILLMLLAPSYSFAKLSNEYIFNCVYVEKQVYRCENKEVICYVSSGYDNMGTPFCKFKVK